MVKSKPIEDARCSFLSVFGKVRKTGSNPASPALKEKTGIQIIAGVSVFFVVSMPNNQLDIHIEHV